MTFTKGDETTIRIGTYALAPFMRDMNDKKPMLLFVKRVEGAASCSTYNQAHTPDGKQVPRYVRRWIGSRTSSFRRERPTLGRASLGCL